MSVYLSTGRTFHPNADVDRLGASFDPQSGRAQEAGVKFESAIVSMGGHLTPAI